MTFCSRTPKLGLSRLWRHITFSADLWLRWVLKQSCSPRWELSNGMWQATCTQGNRDSRLLVVVNQIPNSTPGLFFGHNLCFRCSNGSWEPISDIYVPRAFQCYKERLNPMGFDPCNHSLKIWESTGTPTPKIGVPCESEGSFSHTLLHS
jgi:hypothetical protein